MKFLFGIIAAFAIAFLFCGAAFGGLAAGVMAYGLLVD